MRTSLTGRTPNSTTVSPDRTRAVLGFVAFGVFWGAWGAVLPAVRTGSHADDGQLGTALLMIGLGALLTMRLTGRLVDRFGAKVQPIAMAVFGTVGLLPGLVSSPKALIGALLVLGAASGATDVTINAAGVLAEQRGARPVMNLAHALFSVCVVLASLATAALRALGASCATVLGAALVVIGVLAAVVAILPASRAPDGPSEDGGDDHRAKSIRRWRVPGPLLVFGLLGALAYLVENAWQSWSAVHLQNTLHSGPGVAALAPAVFATAAASGRLLGNRLARTQDPVSLLVAGSLVAAAGTAVAAAAPLLWLGFLGIAVAGLGTSVCAPTVISLAGRWAGPNRRGAAISTVTTLSYLGFLLGPAAVGLTAAATNLRVALGAVALVASLLAAAAPLARRITSRSASSNSSPSPPATT